MNRAFWFVAGTGAGVYVMVKARRAAEALTPEGLSDRIAGLGVGAHLFAQEVRAGRAEKETELRERLGLTLYGPPELPAAQSTAVVSPGSTGGTEIGGTAGTTDRTEDR